MRAGTVGGGADAAARVAADEPRGAQGLATLFILWSAKLLGAPMARFNTANNRLLLDMDRCFAREIWLAAWFQ